MKTLDDILSAHGIGNYSDLLREHRIDVDVFGELSAEDLKELGIPLGDRKRILAIARELAQPDPARNDIASGWKETDVYADSEIRQITALFADLVGSTQLAEDLMVEEYHSALTAFHESSAQVVLGHDGTPVRFIGDAILACFGYPSAAEDDATRAVHAASEIVEQVRTIRTAHGGTLAARVGIATGVAMTGEVLGQGKPSFGPASGAILNLAARLQALAEPGSVLIDDNTRGLLRKDFNLLDLGKKELKGFAEPRGVWQVEAMADAIPVAGPVGRETPLVGRKEELDRLRRHWRDADRKGSFVLVTGEAGIGKSCLVEEFIVQSALPDAQVMRLECQPNETLRPLHPVVQLIEGIAGTRWTRDLIEQRKRLHAWLVDSLKLSPRTVDLIAQFALGPPTDATDDGISARERKAEIFDVLVQIVERQGLDQPRLYFLEDIHWIDPTTEEFLDHLAERIAPLRALVICTYRPDHAPAFVGEANVRLVSLSRLDGEQSADVMRGVLGNRILPPDIVAEIVSRGEGVPFFVEELTRSAIEAATHPGTGACDRNPGTLPTTLRGSLLARLDRVPSMQKIAPVGAAIGRAFRRSLLLGVAGVPENEAEPILNSLIDTGLITVHGSDEDPRYAFKHALVRDAAYETMPRVRRAGVHRKIAEVLEAESISEEPTRPEVLAWHWSEAQEHEKACERWQVAAAAALRASASTEAVAHIHAALDANEKSRKGSGKRDRELNLREMLFVPLEVTNWGSSEIASNIERMQQLHEELRPTHVPIGVLHGLSGYHVIGGRVALARKYADEILAKSSPTDLVAKALGMRCQAFCDFLSGDFDGAIPKFREIQTLCRSIDRKIIARFYHADTALVAQCMICWALGLRGDERELEREAEIASRMISEVQVPWDQVYALHLMSSAYQCIGDASQCMAYVSRALPLAFERGLDYWIGWGSVLKGWAMTCSDASTQGIPEMQEGLRRYASTGSKQMIPYAKTLLADAHRIAGHITETRALLCELAMERDPAEVRYVDVLIDRIAAKIGFTTA